MAEEVNGQDLKDRLKALDETAVSEIEQAKNERELDEVRIKYLSKKGELTKILRSLGKIEPSMRPEVGSQANELRDKLSKAISGRKDELLTKKIQEAAETGEFDPTVPPTRRERGSLHPVTIIQRELEEIFRGLGFMVVDGPELELDFYNFEALNIPRDHPARDMQDTYWVSDNLLLRTQTSACQVRAMREFGVPIRMIAPGRCFRNEDVDVSHENTFFQLEGLLVDRNVSVANLIHVMKTVLGEVFHQDVAVRLRPGYFPFVEPGFELDLKCLICGGDGCPTCGHSGWIELIPCGMVHPTVLEYGGVDPREYSGFAFGLGLSRLVMMKYGISDVRVLNSGDLRSLTQFGAYTVTSGGESS